MMDGMLRTLTILFCLAAPAAAARVESGWFEFPFSTNVHRFEWTLSGDGVAPVHLAFWLPTYAGNIYTTAYYDQPRWGFVRDDWQAALNDPAYVLSTITLDGVSQSGPVQRFGGPFQLELFQFGVNYNYPPNYELITPYIFAMDTAELPEPPTWLLAFAVVTAWIAFRSSRRRTL